MSVKLTDNSASILSAMSGAKKRALEAIGLTAEAHAKEYETAVDTGRLRNSITHATKDDAVYIGTNVEYAPYIELGNRGRPALHYLQKAATQHSEEYKAIVKSSLENA